MLDKDMILKLYTFKLDMLAPFMYNRDFARKMLNNAQKFGIFSEEEADSFEIELKASVRTLALVLGRDWEKDLEKFKGSC